MSKEDVVFTIGADGSEEFFRFLAFSRAARESMWYSADVNVIDFLMFMPLVTTYAISNVKTFL